MPAIAAIHAYQNTRVPRLPEAASDQGQSVDDTRAVVSFRFLQVTATGRAGRRGRTAQGPSVSYSQSQVAMKTAASSGRLASEARRYIAETPFSRLDFCGLPNQDLEAVSPLRRCKETQQHEASLVERIRDASIASLQIFQSFPSSVSVETRHGDLRLQNSPATRIWYGSIHRTEVALSRTVPYCT